MMNAKYLFRIHHRNPLITKVNFKIYNIKY